MSEVTVDNKVVDRECRAVGHVVPLVYLIRYAGVTAAKRSANKKGAKPRMRPNTASQHSQALSVTKHAHHSLNIGVRCSIQHRVQEFKQLGLNISDTLGSSTMCIGVGWNPHTNDTLCHHTKVCSRLRHSSDLICTQY